MCKVTQEVSGPLKAADEMNDILIGKGEKPVHLLAKYGNRHGLVAGATGTGKTVSLLVLAEGFSRLGVPVFMADVKGDVAGLAMPGAAERQGSAARGADRRRRLHERSEPGRLLGSLRQVGPSGPDHDQRDGPDAARAHARAERHAVGRARHRLQAGGRQGPAARRSRRSPRAAGVRCRQAQGRVEPVRPGERPVDCRDSARRSSRSTATAGSASSASRRSS